ncbi:MAG: sigma-54-dependent Fis family transcriptional regulator, partial [Clostridia bacterium]|nr:sigma-54-dependent Fis family transcriptional regulator [Deltaproteobacteria bacterium]
DASPRAAGPFVAVNCGAIPETLIEAELFGHVSGAFTGATKARAGIFETAHGGTLLLDEIGELPQQMQVKLLRVIQERTVRRVGEEKERNVDVRIVAATNRDLQEMVKDGQFREDLFYRLNVVRLRVPPLRERRDDVPLLARTFLLKFAGETVTGFSDDAMNALKAFPFPGNVRELENVVERAVALAGTTQIELTDLPDEVRSAARPRASSAMTLPEAGLNLEMTLDALERSLIEQALEKSGGVKTRAAELLGLTFRSLRYRLKKLDMTSGEIDGDDDDA